MKNAVSTQRGVSLVELMVSITIGLLIMAAILSLFTSTIGVNSTYLRATQLNHEVRSVMAAVARDLRRAGYNGTNFDMPAWRAYSGSITDPAADIPLCDEGATSELAVRYFLNDEDAAQSTFAYRLNNNVIQTRTGETGTFSALTDPNTTEITIFALCKEPSNPTDPEKARTIRRWVEGKCLEWPYFRIEINAQHARDPKLTTDVIDGVLLRNVILTSITQETACN